MGTNSSKFQKLFRPVGKTELELIINSKNKEYPPRLEWQPIFYPVLNYEYARQIAVKWNLDDEFSGYCGFVTEFEIRKEYLKKYPAKNVGGSIHNELWIPANELSEFNSQIEGYIQISGRYYGDKYEGKISDSHYFEELSVKEQLPKLKTICESGEIIEMIKREKRLILLNWDYWRLNLEEDIQREIMKNWKEVYPEIELRTCLK